MYISCKSKVIYLRCTKTPPGSILFSFSLFGKIVGVCMVLNAMFNAYILWKYPGYEDIQRNDAQSDIKEFLAANPAFAKKMVNASVDIIKSNPGKNMAPIWRFSFVLF